MYKELAGGMHIVTITYDNGRSGDLEIPVDFRRRNTPEQQMYVRQMVFGRHMWNKKSAPDYEHLENLINAALPD